MVCEQEEIYSLIKESDTDFDGNHFLFDYFITSIDLSDHYAMCEVPSASINKELEINYDEDLKEFYVTVDFSAEETGKMPLGITDMIVVVYNPEGKQQSLKRILIKVLKKGNVLPQVTYTTHQELVETAGVAIAQVIKTPAYDHDTLRHRDYDDQHPISAITGLQDALAGKVDTTDAANKIYGTDSEGNQTTYDNPTIGNATLTLQKNGSALDTFTANATVDKIINIPIPVKASDVNALPDSTKYTAGLSLSLDPSTYVLTIQLKDQDGTNIGEARTVDLPLESTVVSGSYDAENKKIILVLQSGATIDIPVGDLIEGLQSTITGAATTITDNDLTANKALISNAQGKVAVSSVSSTELGYVSGVTSAIQTQLNNKQATIGDLDEIRSGAAAGATALQPNTAITTGTKCKITYDTKGLVTAGADLQASDIPSLSLSKISDVTASAEELNVLDGITASTAELNILDGVTATASEINVLDGITATTEELNYVDGVTSAIQTQLNNKQDAKPDGTNPLISNNKVSNTYLSDYLLGQMLYAGAFEVLTATATLTTNAKSKLGTTDNTIVLTNDNTPITGYGANEGCFYICTSDGNFAGIALLTGDWLISTGTSWTKVDNTDAVTGVKGNAESTYRLGNVNITLDNVAPSQANNSGKFITTDGTNTSWGSLPVSDVTVDNTSVVNNGTAVIPNATASTYGVVKYGGIYGIGVTSTDELKTVKATTAFIDDKTNNYYPIVPSNLDYAVKVGVTTNANTLTAQEKSDACDWLGAVKDVTVDSTSVVSNGVAEIPNASGSVTGVVRLSANLTSISDTIAATASMGNNLAKNIITGVNTYSSSSTYSVGEKVRYGQYYYECITAITSAHAWNANEWRQITIQGEIDAKQDILTAGDGGKYIDIIEQVTLPSGYSRLDYVTNEASASPYTRLDLGIKPQEGDIIESVFVVNKAAMSNYFVQARETSGSAIYGLAGASSGSTISCAVNGTTADISLIRINGHKYYAKASYIAGTCSLYVKDMTYNLEDYGTNTYTWADINQNYNLWGNGQNTMPGEQPVQFVKITNNGSVRCHLVAATDGVNSGFYDLVNGTFITSMTVGSVTGGNVISNPTVVNTTLRNKDFIYFGTSSTAAATVEKVVNIPEITQLEEGQLIIVTPTLTSTVANSTIKLNNFDAYPMLYGGVAITTSTDSYVWIKDVPGWWLFDGSNWLFAGHGTDINTTYNSMTLALMIAGENTTNRLIASSTLKDGTFGVVTAYASGDTITPADKYLYNNTGDITALTVNAPDSPDVRYVSQINFSSGTTATTLSYPNTFKIYDGCDDMQVVDGVKVFIPVANKRYQVWLFNDGVNTLIFAKGA